MISPLVINAYCWMISNLAKLFIENLNACLWSYKLCCLYGAPHQNSINGLWLANIADSHWPLKIICMVGKVVGNSRQLAHINHLHSHRRSEGRQQKASFQLFYLWFYLYSTTCDFYLGNTNFKYLLIKALVSIT